MPPVTALSQRSPMSTPQKPPGGLNVLDVVLGNLQTRPHYPSFYPDDLLVGQRAGRLYVCQWCFNYSPEIIKYLAHTKACPLKDEPPPGDLIFEKDNYAIHQLDGEEHKVYTQNLSLFAKLWLDTKSVFFDVSTFLYYTLILSDVATGTQQVVGFFSKEKMSWDNNNVACILVFPPWQRRGLGQILMAASYELGKKEGRLGGPERPLSTLGKKGYLSYWSRTVYRCIVATPLKRTISIQDISDETFVLREDIVSALKEMNVLDSKKKADGSVIVSKGKIRAWAEKNGVSAKPIIDVSAFLEGVSEEEDVDMEDEDDDDELQN